MLVQSDRVYIVQFRHRHGDDVWACRTYGGAIESIQDTCIDPYLEEWGIQVYPFEDGEYYFMDGSFWTAADLMFNWAELTEWNENIELTEVLVQK